MIEQGTVVKVLHPEYFGRFGWVASIVYGRFYPIEVVMPGYRYPLQFNFDEVEERRYGP